MITEGKLEDRKSRQMILFSQLPLSDSGETYYEYPYYPMLPFPGGESAQFSNQARVPNIRPFTSSSFSTGR